MSEVPLYHDASVCTGQQTRVRCFHPAPLCITRVFSMGIGAVLCRNWISDAARAQIFQRLGFYCRTTSASTAPCTSRRMCCPTHCASYCALCQPQIVHDATAFEAWSKEPSLSSDDLFQETSARYRAVEPSSGPIVIPRRARPGLAGLRPHTVSILDRTGYGTYNLFEQVIRRP